MARQFWRLIAPLFIAAIPAFAQEPPPTGPVSKAERQKRAAAAPEFADVRKALEALTPEQRKRFKENFVRWSNLPPEEKKNLRDRDAFRRKRMAEDIEAAITETGLTLEKEKRIRFAKRYAEERRKLEEQLRRETEERRQPRLKAILQQLKAEFSTPSVAPTAPAAGQ